MCIIIDINAIPSVFNPNIEDHAEFKPVLNWIISGDGFMIYGGTKYKDELKKLVKYLGFILELQRNNKVRVVCEKSIDDAEAQIKEIIPDNDFDDPHIAAIVKITACRLICSKDIRSVKYIQNRALYCKGFILPRYYTGIRNKGLLCPTNIPVEFRSTKRLNKKEQENLLKKK